MPWPSRVLNSGITNPILALNICGDGTTGLIATGTNLATALPIASVYSRFTTVAAATGAALPATENGMLLVVANDGANALLIYAPSGSTVDGAASFSLQPGGRVLFVTVSLTVWVSVMGTNGGALWGP